MKIKLLSGALLLFAPMFAQAVEAAPAPVARPLYLMAPDTRLTAGWDEQRDGGVGQVGAQSIAKIQWTLDGDDTHENRWHDVDAKTMVQITRHASLGVRAIKAIPEAPWGDNEVLGPTWTLQGNSVEGEEVWLEPQNPALLGATVTATLGNSLSFQVRVLPDPYVTFTIPKGYAVLPANATQTQPALISLKVEDEDGNPLANTKVRIRAYKGKSAIVSSWTPQGGAKSSQSADEILVTNDAGEIYTEWSAAAGLVVVGDQVMFKAEVIDEEGKPFGDDDTFKVRIFEEDIK